MNPHPLFCPNLTCASRGVQGAGNIRVHDSQRDRWRCTTCHKTFSARQGTPFFGLKTDPAIVAQVVTLLSYGCPLQAIVAAFGYDERTIRDWQDKAGAHCQQVHTALVCQADLDLKQVQADELRVRCQKRLVVWMALALCVPTPPNQSRVGSKSSPHCHSKLVTRNGLFSEYTTGYSGLSTRREGY